MFGTRSRWTYLRGVVVGVTLTAWAAAPALASGPITYGQTASGKVTIAGSSALQPLVDEASKNYQAANPNVQITVSAGGSGAGRSGACQGSVDIGMSDVPLTDQEISTLNCAEAVQTAVAIEAFAVTANPKGAGSLQGLTREQMQGLFTGQITNWSQVGGDDQQVVLINRLKGSGTRQQMANYLFRGDDTQFAVGASEEDDSQTVVNTVGSTPGAISYLGLAFLDSPQLVTVGIQQADGSVLMPTKDTVSSGVWPIGGPGLAITRGQGNEVANGFITYMLSPQFESDPIWDALGFVVPSNPSIGTPTGQ